MLLEQHTLLVVVTFLLLSFDRNRLANGKSRRNRTGKNSSERYMLNTRQFLVK